jgi:hypothetical protein
MRERKGDLHRASARSEAHARRARAPRRRKLQKRLPRTDHVEAPRVLRNSSCRRVHAMNHTAVALATRRFAGERPSRV